MYGDQGWYDYRSSRTSTACSSSITGRCATTTVVDWATRVGLHSWKGNPGYPEAALRGEFAALRRKVEAMRLDTTTPDTRLADDPMAFNPATVDVLVQLMLGGLPPKHQGEILHARLRYFDPVRRRPGLPEDVAALVETLTDRLDLARAGQPRSIRLPRR